MRKISVIAALLISPMATAQKPPGLPISTWVREDLFAGFLANDMDRLRAGMQKVEDLLRENPKNAGALAWKGLGQVTLAVRSLEAGNRKEFDREYAAAIDLFEQCLKMAPNNEGVFAIYGGTMIMFAPRVPADLQRGAWEKARAMFTGLYGAQKETLAKMPPHFQGEVLAGLAESEHHLGNAEQSRVWLRQIVANMPATPYERRAQQWLAKPESISTGNRVVCQTCHDAGRLKNRLAAIGQQSK